MHFSFITPQSGMEREAAHDWVRSAYEQHQWLWRFFPAPAGTPRRFVFRRRDVDGLPRFYVVSELAPATPSADWEVRSKPYDPELTEGQWLNFELRANPVVTHHGARHDVVMQEKKRLLEERGLAHWADWTTPDRPAMSDVVQRAGTRWLMARCARLGIDVDEASLRVEGYEQHGGKGAELRFSSVDYSGQLRVADAKALRAALLGGVGHGKAFGCGLLLVRPRAAS